MTRCNRCNKPLTNPASIQLGYGPICAGKLGIVRYSDPKYRKLFDPSCVCPFCDGTIERVVAPNSFDRHWNWTCGGVSGDGCHRDYGCNTVAPLRVNKSELKLWNKIEPEKFEKAKNERAFHKAVADKTYEIIGVHAVPPYPGPTRVFHALNISPAEQELMRQQINHIVKYVWNEFHKRGYYGKYCSFYDPTIGHCKECGTPKQKTEFNENGICQKCASRIIVI